LKTYFLINLLSKILLIPFWFRRSTTFLGSVLKRSAIFDHSSSDKSVGYLLRIDSPNFKKVFFYQILSLKNRFSNTLLDLIPNFKSMLATRPEKFGIKDAKRQF